MNCCMLWLRYHNGIVVAAFFVILTVLVSTFCPTTIAFTSIDTTTIARNKIGRREVPVQQKHEDQLFYNEHMTTIATRLSMITTATPSTVPLESSRILGTISNIMNKNKRNNKQNNKNKNKNSNDYWSYKVRCTSSSTRIHAAWNFNVNNNSNNKSNSSNKNVEDNNIEWKDAPPLEEIDIAIENGDTIDNNNDNDDSRTSTFSTTVPYSSSSSLSTISSPSLSLSPRRPCLIKVIGVGGGGGNAVNRMIETNIEGVSFCAINTDAQALSRSLAPTTLNIGQKLTRGLGAGGNAAEGAKAALENVSELRAICTGADMIFITAGMGGGTGSGAAPILANIAKQDCNCLTVGVVTKPFGFEGKKRMEQAERAIEELQKVVDTLIVVSNDRLLQIVPDNTPVTAAFLFADDILRQGVVGISEIILKTGLVNVDFADVRAVMSNAGTALIGVGKGKGRNRAYDAATAAISSPLLDYPLNRARRIVFNIVGGPDMGLNEINEASEVIYDNADDDANIIFGALIDPTMLGEISITVLACDFDTISTTTERKTSFQPPVSIPRTTISSSSSTRTSRAIQLKSSVSSPAPVALKTSKMSSSTEGRTIKDTTPMDTDAMTDTSSSTIPTSLQTVTMNGAVSESTTGTSSLSTSSTNDRSIEVSPTALLEPNPTLTTSIPTTIEHNIIHQGIGETVRTIGTVKGGFKKPPGLKTNTRSNRNSNTSTGVGTGTGIITTSTKKRSKKLQQFFQKLFR